MPKYIVRYESREYYEKEYEADTADDAVDMFREDDRIFDSGPYSSETEIMEVLDEQGDVAW